MSNKKKIYIGIAILLILLFGKKVSALNIIKKFEGLELTSYPDTGGIWTIGFGATINKDTGQAIKQGDKIDLETAERWLNQDISEREKKIKALIKVPVTENMKAAMVSLAYNIGTGAFGSSTLLKLLNSGADKKLVADQFLRWNKVQGKEVKGLTNRRKLERELFLKQFKGSQFEVFLQGKISIFPFFVPKIWWNKKNVDKFTMTNDLFKHLKRKTMKKTAIQIILIVLGCLLICFADNL